MQVNDIAEIKDRNADYSNNVKIPKSPTNVLTFEMLGITGTLTRLPYTKVDVKYVVDGIELISDGKGIIKNTNKYYNLIIYDGNISMFELIGDARMNELDFSSYNHTLTQTIFTDSFTNTDGYIYALAEFFLDSTFFSVIDIDLTSPSLFMHTLFSNIFTEKGYTISGAILTDTDFKSRLISMNNGYDRFTTENKTFKQVLISNQFESESYGTTPTNATFLIDTYTAVTTVTHTINVNGKINVQAGSDYEIVFFVNNVRKDAVDVPVLNTAFQLDHNIQLSIGDVLEIHVGANSTIVVTTEKIQFDTDWTHTIYENNLSITIDFALLMGEMKQIDFVKDVMQRFGMMFKKTKNDLNFEFTTMKTVLTDKAGSENWTDKNPRFINERYKPSYAQVNFLKYKYNDDSDANTELVYADGEIVIPNVNLDFSKTLFTSVFKASTFTNSGFWTLSHWITKENEIIINEDGLGVFKQIDSGGSFQFRFNGDSGGSSPFTGTFPLLNFDSLFYSKEIANWYKEFESMLSDFKFLTLEMNLSVVDIYEIDFFKLKYFKQFSQYYYLNKVISFRKGKNTRVELIQIGADVIGAVVITATSTGESVVSSTLTKVTAGQMISHILTGCTSVATLTAASASLTDFNTSTNGASAFAVCSRALDITRWHDGLGSAPVLNDIVYEDEAGTILFNGGSNWYKTDTNSIQINTTGDVIDTGSC